MMKDFIDSSEYLLPTNQMNATFNVIAEECKFKRWYFGKFHKNKIIPPRFQVVFGDVVKLETPDLKNKK